MRTATQLALLLAFGAGGFVAGNLQKTHRVAAEPAAIVRKILHYVDPMNPTHTSDQPGLAPCGMKLEPVYADSHSVPRIADGSEVPAAGSLWLSPERQQLAGIQIAEVQAKALAYTLRLPGRVVADEARVHRVKAAVSGYIGRAFSHGTGSLVEQGEVLAELNSPELLPAVQSLLFALGTRNRTGEGATPDAAFTNSVFEFDLSYQQSLETLLHMGMGQRQLNDLIQTRTPARGIAIASPAAGVLTVRSVSPGLHVAMGEELFRVVDLSRVWILTDVSGWESECLTPGMAVRVSAPRQARTFMATVSKALPLFDNDARTLKVRLEMDNSDHALRPDMFVDVELPVTLPETVFISGDAVLDTGRKQSVFVDRRDGYFEPREVRTGRHLGGLVEIVHGLTPGERIVNSGNFLLDSESRMKQAAARLQVATVKDPVCGMTVDEREVAAAGHASVYQGQSYYFCNPNCKRSFDADPARFAKTQSKQTAAATLTAGQPVHH